MRDILNDLDAGRRDFDPMARARQAMRTPMPKRFYEAVDVAGTESGHEVRLDGKTARTPGGKPLSLPNRESAEIVAAEFSAQGEVLDLPTMSATRLVNTALDGVATDPQAVLEDILRFAGTDLLCYRADAPAELVERQAEAWDPVLDWARSDLSARFILSEGVMHVDQPREALAAIGVHLRRRSDPLSLACLHVMTSLMGSALLALAVAERQLTPDAAWTAAHVDEDWNIDQWGEDEEARARRANRRRDMMAAAALLLALAD